MPLTVQPLIPRRVNLSSPFGFSPKDKVETKETGYQVRLAGRTPEVFTSEDEAFKGAAGIVFRNIGMLHRYTCQVACKCGWEQGWLLQQKKAAYEKAGLPFETTILGARARCYNKLEQATQYYHQLLEAKSREDYRLVIQTWNYVPQIREDGYGVSVTLITTHR